MNQKRIGNEGETFVAHQLYKQGFTIMARNYRRQFGEIDIIAQKKELLIFVEVKVRAPSSVDHAEIILPSKQHKIIQVAKAFIALHNITDKICRFDVAFVHPVSENNF